MTERKTDTTEGAAKNETLIDRYRPLGLKAVAAAALHQKPKAAAQPAKVADRIRDWREH
ncbi:hypothetical protein C8J38_1011086 [Rhizobium sp. PP-WC-2G-219]|nr:hypothetical protein C8J38_1011086 [Rhizobium sp. PP-WC-2G-219]